MTADAATVKLHFFLLRNKHGKPYVLFDKNVKKKTKALQVPAILCVWI